MARFTEVKTLLAILLVLQGEVCEGMAIVPAAAGNSPGHTRTYTLVAAAAVSDRRVLFGGDGDGHSDGGSSSSSSSSSNECPDDSGSQCATSCSCPSGQSKKTIQSSSGTCYTCTSGGSSSSSSTSYCPGDSGSSCGTSCSCHIGWTKKTVHSSSGTCYTCAGVLSGAFDTAKLKVCTKLAAKIYKGGNADACGTITEGVADTICDAALGGPEDPVGDVACPVEVEEMCKGLAKYIEKHTHTDPASTCKSYLGQS